jgi:hypothetical protein
LGFREGYWFDSTSKVGQNMPTDDATELFAYIRREDAGDWAYECHKCILERKTIIKVTGEILDDLRKFNEYGFKYLTYEENLTKMLHS